MCEASLIESGLLLTLGLVVGFGSYFTIRMAQAGKLQPMFTDDKKKEVKQ